MTFVIAMSLCIITAGWGRVVMKKALENKPPLVCALIFEIVQTLLAVPFFKYYQTPTDLSYSIFSGTLFAISLTLYFMVYKGSEVSLLTPLRGLRGIFALIISLLFLHESLHLFEALGIIVIGLGVLFLQRASKFKKLFHFLFHREAILMMLSVVLGVFSSYLDKLGTTANGYFSYYFFTCLSAVIALTIAVFIQNGKKTWTLVITDISRHNITVGIIFAVSFITQLIALQYERVTIVNGLLPLGVLVTTYLAGRYLKESVLGKIPGTVFVVIGTILMAL